MVDERASQPHQVLQLQARALGDPTRHRLFRFIADAGRPVDVAELTEHIGLHHNAVRQHLAKLVDAGLVVEATARASRRGRPRLRYAVDATADGRWGVVGPYERLSLLLTEVIRTGGTPVEVGRRAAHHHRPGARAAVDPVEDLVERMAHHGFDPEVRRHGDEAEIVLRTCPFAATALADPDTICGLHLGLAYGMADSHPDLVIDGLTPRDPRQAHCSLRCHLER